ncbi:MAG TPA: hypothetical protein VHN80_17130 [Kineosporiaceae bacterium]|nr:hypothetical protein [Kineosporiaceae bacterium]
MTLGPAVLAGWWAHLLGDFCTSDRWPVLAPFTFRQFGGLRLIRPTPIGRRVTCSAGKRGINTGE